VNEVFRMNNEHSASRRAALRSLGAMGAVIALGGTAAGQSAAETKPTKSDAVKQAANPVDVAVERFAKGHS